MENELKEQLLNLQDILEAIFNFSIFRVNDTPITISSFIILALILGLVTYASKMASKVLRTQILNKFDVDQAITYTLSKLVQYAIIVLGSIFGFQFIGIDLSGLTVIFGLLSVGIGFGLQNLTSNFISGLIVLFERPISIGDRVIVSGIEGDISDISIRATTIVTLDNKRIIVPNEKFISSEVINMTHGDRKLRLDLPVGVSYSSDLDVVIKALEEVASESKSVMKSPKAEVHFTNFGDSSWDMELRVWINNAKSHPSVRTELNMAIVRKFREHKVEIPFPQRDLHVISPKIHKINTTPQVIN